MRPSGLPLAASGSRANNTPCQTPLCPKRRPPRPQQPIFSVFHRGGLHFEHRTTTNRNLTASKRGNRVIRAATRRRHAASQLLMLHPPAGQIGNQHRHTAAGWCPSRCPWAAAGHSRASKQRRLPHQHTRHRPLLRAPRGPRSRAEVPVGGGRAWPGFEIDDSEPKARVRRSRGRAAAHRHTQRSSPHRQTSRCPEIRRIHNQHPQRNEAATGFPATASSRSISAAQNDGTAQIGATQQSGTASDQAVMSTWSSTAARPASRRATGTRNGEQDT